MGNQNIGGIACQFADQLGRTRQLSAEECAYFQGLASTSGDPCECADPTPKPTPTTMMGAATMKPTIGPTTPEPTTLAPTRNPTPEPTTAAPTPSPTVATPFCNICRDSPILFPQINNPLATIASLEQQMTITCQQAQDTAIQKGGQPGLTEAQCLDFQALAVGTCGCPFEPTNAPVVDPSPAPSTKPDTIPDCPVCQNGEPIGNSTGMILDKTCTEWNVLGTNGLLTLEECVSVQLLAQTPLDPCGCDHPSTLQPTPAPTTVVVAPTAVPTVPPTPLGDRVEFCNICRDATFGDLSLGRPNATLASFISGGISIQCGFAQFLGSTLNPQGPVYTLEQCAIAQSLAVGGTCGCPNEPTAAPVVAPIPAVVTPQPTDPAPGVYCLICPNGNMATGLGVLGSMLCQDVDTMARMSELTDEECLAAQTRAAQDDDPCGCSGGAPAPAPVAPGTTSAPVATAAPVVVVPTTVAPTMMPTLALEPCNLCVNPFEFITNDDGVLFTDAITGVELTCEQAQIVGFSFGYTAQECNLLQFQASGTCGCPSDPGTPTGAPATAPTTPAPVPPATPAPVGSPETVFCTVCQNGTPATGGTIGGVTCAELDAMGRLLPDGTFTLFQCLTIQTAAIIAPGDPCNCNFVTP